MFAVGLLLALGVGGARAEDARTTRVDEAIRKAIGDGGAGVAAAVVSGDALLYANGAGFADIASKTPITTRTVFDLASCSKQFTAMAVMILADRGALTFEDDARRWLPELPAQERPLRVSDLLHHTSGLPDYLELMTEAEIARGTNAGVLERVATSKREFAPGARHSYSNTNYALLSLVVERASRKSLARFLADEIWTPLGMTDTLVLDRVGGAIPGRAAGYVRTGAVWKEERLDAAITGDGNVFSSIRDLVLWDRALRAGKLVKAATLARAFTSGKLDDGTLHHYGFGWVVSEGETGRCVSHSGEWSGTSTSIARYLDEGLTVLVLWNASGEDAEKLGEEIAGILRR